MGEIMDSSRYSQYPPGQVPPHPPGYPQPPGFPQPPVSPDAGKGLAISAVVIGGVSLLLCWVPLVNNMVFLLGLVGLGLAIPALVISVRRKTRAKGLAIAGLILSLLSLVGVLATQAFYSQMLNEVVDSIEGRSDGVVESSETEAKEATATEALALGAAAGIGDYSVTITGVDTNATETILAVNQFNPLPSGQYVLVDVGVTYNGSEEGNPWLDLTIKFIGADARQYDTTTCSVVVSKEAHDVPTLEKGGAGEFQVCMDVPPEALVDAKVFVQEGVSWDDNRVYWAVP